MECGFILTMQVLMMNSNDGKLFMNSNYASINDLRVSLVKWKTVLFYFGNICLTRCPTILILYKAF